MAKTPNSERVYAFKLASFLALSRLIADGATATFDVVYIDGAHRVRKSQIILVTVRGHRQFLLAVFEHLIGVDRSGNVSLK